MIKKKFFFLIFFLVVNCSYQPIYSQKDDNKILFDEIEFIGDKNINRKIASLANLKEDKNNSTSYNLIIDSSKLIETVVKDGAGNSSIYSTKITVNLTLLSDNKKLRNKEFISNFLYNNMDNKFDLSQYQKNIEKNLINKIAEDIIIFLSL